MTVSTVNDLVEIYKNNHETIHRQIAGITQAESLIQPPFQGNCLNWVLGHVVVARGQALQLLGLPGTFTPEEIKLYGHGSEPITGPANAIDIDVIVSKLDDSITRLTDKLNSMSPADLEKEVRIWRGPVPLSSAISFQLWHETYHTGQLELLRQLAGKNDKIL